MGIPLGTEDWAIRCNLVHIENECMCDFTAGHITSEEGGPLIDALQKELGDGKRPKGARLEFHAGVSYRNILVYRPAPGTSAPFSDQTKTQPPHDVPDRPIVEHLPKGPGSDLLRSLMESSRASLRDHPVNQKRRARVPPERDATQIWLWGQGKAPSLRPFAEVYGKRGAIISAVDLVRGVGVLLGWQRIDVTGATGYLDTDYAAKGRAAVAALPQYDMCASTSKHRTKHHTRVRLKRKSRRSSRSIGTSLGRCWRRCPSMAIGASLSHRITVPPFGLAPMLTAWCRSRSLALV
jgi:2,3-bisphosphoglycerate-independent phosphoglycerate mutase